MIELFGFSLAFGGLLVGAGALGGGHHDDGDGGADHDAGGHDAGGHDVDDHGGLHDDLAEHAPIAATGAGGHGGSAIVDAARDAAMVANEGTGPKRRGPPFWTSLRFWSFGTASFGATGLLALAVGFSDPGALALAAPTGMGIGAAAAWAFRRLRTDRVSGEVTLERFVGAEGTVAVPVRRGQVGRVRLSTAGGVHELTARSGDAHDLPVGAKVLISAVRDGVADVTQLAPPPREVSGGERAGDARAPHARPTDTSER
jgi:hypothetical protein